MMMMMIITKRFWLQRGWWWLTVVIIVFYTTFCCCCCCCSGFSMQVSTSLSSTTRLFEAKTAATAAAAAAASSINQQQNVQDMHHHQHHHHQQQQQPSPLPFLDSSLFKAGATARKFLLGHNSEHFAAAAAGDNMVAVKTTKIMHILIDVENVRGKSGFVLSHEEIIHAIYTWTMSSFQQQQEDVVQVTLVIDHGSESSQFWLQRKHHLHINSNTTIAIAIADSANANSDIDDSYCCTTLQVVFAGKHCKADDVIANNVALLLDHQNHHDDNSNDSSAVVIVVTADNGLMDRCKRRSLSFLSLMTSRSARNKNNKKNNFLIMSPFLLLQDLQVILNQVPLPTFNNYYNEDNDNNNDDNVDMDSASDNDNNDDNNDDDNRITRILNHEIQLGAQLLQTQAQLLRGKQKQRGGRNNNNNNKRTRKLQKTIISLRNKLALQRTIQTDDSSSSGGDGGDVDDGGKTMLERVTEIPSLSTTTTADKVLTMDTQNLFLAKWTNKKKKIAERQKRERKYKNLNKEQTGDRVIMAEYLRRRLQQQATAVMAATTTTASSSSSSLVEQEEQQEEHDPVVLFQQQQQQYGGEIDSYSWYTVSTTPPTSATSSNNSSSRIATKEISATEAAAVTAKITTTLSSSSSSSAAVAAALHSTTISENSTKETASVISPRRETMDDDDDDDSLLVLHEHQRGDGGSGFGSRSRRRRRDSNNSTSTSDDILHLLSHSKSLRLVVISDTHGFEQELTPPSSSDDKNDNNNNDTTATTTRTTTTGSKRSLLLPPGDVLLHLGDFAADHYETSQEKIQALHDFDAWLAQQPHDVKIVVRGNHDPRVWNFVASRAIYITTPQTIIMGGGGSDDDKNNGAKAIISTSTGTITSISNDNNEDEDHSMTIVGSQFSFTIVPHLPGGENAFSNRMIKKSILAPTRRGGGGGGCCCDVFVSHIPPRDLLDRCSSGSHVGSFRLRKSVSRMASLSSGSDVGGSRLLLWLCGHIHESRGMIRHVFGHDDDDDNDKKAKKRNKKDDHKVGSETLVINAANANAGIARCIKHGPVVLDLLAMSRYGDIGDNGMKVVKKVNVISMDNSFTFLNEQHKRSSSFFQSCHNNSNNSNVDHINDNQVGELLVAVDLGLKTGISLWGGDGKLLEYQDLQLESLADVRAVAETLLLQWVAKCNQQNAIGTASNDEKKRDKQWKITHIAVEGADVNLRLIWRDLAASWPPETNKYQNDDIAGSSTAGAAALLIVRPEEWRADLLSYKEQQSGQLSKEASRLIARQLVADYGGRIHQGKFQTDAAESILLGYHVARRLGWMRGDNNREPPVRRYTNGRIIVPNKLPVLA